MLTRRSLVGAFAAVPVLTAACRKLAAEELPKLAVTKDPNCGCCHGWTDHTRAASFPVEIVETGELNQAKARLGVPRHLAACHTAEVDAYVSRAISRRALSDGSWPSGLRSKALRFPGCRWVPPAWRSWEP